LEQAAKRPMLDKEKGEEENIISRTKNIIFT